MPSIGANPGRRSRAAKPSCAEIADGTVRELLPAPFSARSRVHEYGGGEFLVAGEIIYFSNDGDQQIYAFRAGEAPAASPTQPTCVLPISLWIKRASA